MVGGVYDQNVQKFIDLKPYESWILNSEFEWESPVPKPQGPAVWNESDQSWNTPE
jgi:hypothetical protein